MINQYYFQYRNLTIAIYSKTPESAFVSWKRFNGKFNIPQSEFEKNLIERPDNFSDVCILTGDDLSKEETFKILHTKKSSKTILINENLPRQEGIKTVKIIEYVTKKEADDNLGTDTITFEVSKPVESIQINTLVKRGRGRPPGSKNKTVSIQNYFEE